ncbi:RDD family protein [Leeia sp.]|uniref:RDD family protein n=1 Tax=Leeia sp. TaxID=2884678 RepID=UPI0035AFFADD
MRMSHPDNPYAAPQTNVERLDKPISELVDATRWQRLGAAFIDWLLLSIALIAVPVFLSLAFNVRSWSDGFALLETPYGWLDFILWASLLPLLYAAINWDAFKDGQTRGKRMLGIRLIMHDGRPASIKTSVWRMAVFNTLGSVSYFHIGLIITLIDALRIFTADRRCFHDIVFGTRVVEV